jgi:phosphatidylglycerophosphatase A
MESPFFPSLAQCGIFGGWEIVLILAVVLLLFMAKRLPDLAEGLGKGEDEFRKSSRDALEEIRHVTTDDQEAANGKDQMSALTGRRITVWVAQGFGIGRISFGPGTLGALVGMLWLLVLLALGNFWLYLAGIIAGIAVSVWLCGVAEKNLNQADPPSVVLDEIVAMPLCFATWIAILWCKNETMPHAEFFFRFTTWPWTLGVFAAFRLFDVAKPWPVRQSQSLPGGWGVTMDDLLAAAYVNGLAAVLAAFGYLPTA